MKLQQLCYLVEIVKQGLNISEAAKKLHTSQPGISKQIRILEDELGIEIFIRHGKRFIDLTAPGKKIVSIAEQILSQSGNLKRIAKEHIDIETGELTLVATPLQARYTLPKVIQQFRERHPNVQIRIKQANPSQVYKMVLNGEADLAIAAEHISSPGELAKLACYAWQYQVIVPTNHPLLKRNRIITLAELSEYPLITYDATFAGCHNIMHAFNAQHLTPNIVLTAIDSEVIKEYVASGLGVGIIINMAFDRLKDQHLQALDASHLFSPSVTQIGFRKDAYLRTYMYDFIELFSPHLGRTAVQAMLIAAVH